MHLDKVLTFGNFLVCFFLLDTQISQIKNINLERSHEFLS